MGKTEDDFGKKRDHNQYGEVNKDEQDTSRELPKPSNKGAAKDKKE